MLHTRAGAYVPAVEKLLGGWGAVCPHAGALLRLPATTAWTTSQGQAYLDIGEVGVAGDALGAAEALVGRPTLASPVTGMTYCLLAQAL